MNRWSMNMLFDEAPRLLSPAFLLCLHITHARSSSGNPNPLNSFSPPRVQIGCRERLAAAARNGLKQFLQGFRTALRPRRAADVASKFVWDLMQHSSEPWVFNGRLRGAREASLQYDDEPPKPIIHATLCFLRELLLGERVGAFSDVGQSPHHHFCGSPRSSDVVEPKASQSLSQDRTALPQRCGTENHSQVDVWAASFAMRFRQSFLTTLWDNAPKFFSEAVPSHLCALNRAMALATALSADLRLWAGADTPRRSQCAPDGREPACHKDSETSGSWLFSEADQWHRAAHQIRVVDIIALATRDVQIDQIPIVRVPVATSCGPQRARNSPDTADEGKSVGVQLDVLGTFTAAIGALQLADVDDSDSSARASACRDDVPTFLAAGDKTNALSYACNDCDFWTDVLPELVRVLPLTLPSSLVPLSPATSGSTTTFSSLTSTPSGAGTGSPHPSTQAGTSAQVNIRRLALCQRMVWLAVSECECGPGVTAGDSSGQDDQHLLQPDVWSVSLNSHRLNFLFHRVKAAIDESNRRNLWSPRRRESRPPPFDIQALSRVQIGIAQFNSHLSLFQSLKGSRRAAKLSLDEDDRLSTVELSMQVACAYCMWEVQLRPLLVACLNGFPFQNAYRAEMSAGSATSGRPYHDILITYLPLINECSRTLRILERAVRDTGWPLDIDLCDRPTSGGRRIARVARQEFEDSSIIAWVETFLAICTRSGGATLTPPVVQKETSPKVVANYRCEDALLICIQRHAQLLRTALMVASLNFGANVDPATSSPHVDNFSTKLTFVDIWLRANELFSEHVVPSRAPVFNGCATCTSPLQAGCIARSGSQAALQLLGATHCPSDAHRRHATRFLSALLSHRLYELRGARIWGTGMEVEADARFVRGLVECASLTWSDVEREVVLPHALGRCDDLRAFKSLHSLLQDIQIFSAPDWATQDSRDEVANDSIPAALSAPAARWDNIVQQMQRAKDVLLQSVPRLAHQNLAPTTRDASPDVPSVFSERVSHVYHKVVQLRHQVMDFAARRIVIILQRLCERNISILTTGSESRASEYVF